jgi:hypothetical protein
MYKFLLVQKISLKSLHLVIICNLKHFQDEYTKVKFMLRIFIIFM